MKNSTRIFFAGDFCSKPSTSLIRVSDELRELLSSCDLRVVNFEIPLKPSSGQNNVYYFQNDDSPAFLRDLGFDIFSMANNHAFDCGVNGFEKTVSELEGKSFGSGTYDEAYKVKIVELDGMKLGFMALSYASEKGVFDDVSKHEGLGCAYINDLRVNHDIMEAKKNVDFLFVLPHDGIEYIDVPLPETIARYRDLIDYGADAIIGTHPHCPQGWEEYKGKYIFYSLGNFFFNSKATPDFKANKPHWYEGLCVICNITDGKMSFETVNTFNSENRALSIDSSESRSKHNELICNYLKDKDAYDKYLAPTIRKLTMEQEYAVVERFYSKKTFMAFAKTSAKKFKSIITRNYGESHNSLLMLLKNDARRNVTIKGLKNK